MNKKFYIKTYGCSMNIYDSTKLSDLLQINGFHKTEISQEANIIILNTCHIREKAAEKVYADLGRILKYKKLQSNNAKPIVVIAGCVAQAEGDEVIKRAKAVDIVVGSRAYHTLPILIERIENGEQKLSSLTFDEEEKFTSLPLDITSQNISAVISVQEGCDKFCHFCCVPYTRGMEYSRNPESIMMEIKNMIELQSNIIEITLVGQNVSAYHAVDKNNKIWKLSDLLFEVSQIDQIKRVRYITSHPMDMKDEDLFEVHKLSKIMPLVHLPIQSGSDKILKAMNRKHNVEYYLNIIQKFKNKNSKIEFSSDFIVGYPGESDEDFNNTLLFLDRMQYACSYLFKYSPRPGTVAANIDVQIHENIKTERLNILNDKLNKQRFKFNTEFKNREIDVLITGSGRIKGQYLGRSEYFQSVVINSNFVEFDQLKNKGELGNNKVESIIGKIAKIKIDHVSDTSLKGTFIE